MEALGDTDPRVAETCRYLAEAHVQAMQFDEAENLSKKTLEIHRVHSPPASLEEVADRKLMALICEAKGDYKSALEHLVLASRAMIANGQENEVASIDVSIGNIYMSLSRFDGAVFSYQKGSCESPDPIVKNALRIYAKPVPGTTAEEIASEMTEISAIYESFNEPEEALKLLQKVLRVDG
ncbi:protein KINESIN LIGHT CHAIN-RELATED 1-like, partial [Camellia sinensis]|uniref:protein KINESIN LIGHT CHAIN-RELATED 1-like n=1 Tax=Camellia sinensis TaxID=4442 RepID=UPI001036C95E